MNMTKEQIKQLQNIVEFEKALVDMAKRYKEAQDCLIYALEVQNKNINKLTKSLGA